MIPGMNPKDLQKAMKRMGVKQEEIDAQEVIIKCADKNLVIRNPSVLKVNMMGQESLQISGDLEEEAAESYTEEDVETVASQANVSQDVARQALDASDGDLAQAILSLQEQ